MQKENMIMIRRNIVALSALALALVACLGAAPGAKAAGFGFAPGSFDFRFEKQDGSPDLRAAAHPHAVTTEFELKSEPAEGEGTPGQGGTRPVGANLRFADAAVPRGLVGNPTAVPTCPTAEFFRIQQQNHCKDETQVGLATTR